MKQKALILDSSFAIKPLYDALKKQYDVFTIGNNENSYYALTVPERHYLLDYSDIYAVQTLVSLNYFDDVVPGCTDVSLRTFSAIKDNFKTIINDTLTKKSFSDFCKRCGVASPEILSNPIADDLPIIVKPDDSFSGKGVRIVKTMEELNAAVQYASRYSITNTYVCQKYLNGPLKSFSAFRDGSEAVIVNVHEENREGTFGVAESFCFNPEDQLKVKIQKIADKFLNNDVKKLDYIHVQYIVYEGDPYPIELFLRCPGDLYPELIRLSIGVDYGRLYCNAYLKNPLPLNHLVSPTQQVVRKTLFAKSREEAVAQLNHYRGHKIFYTVDLNEDFYHRDAVRFAVVFIELNN